MIIKFGKKSKTNLNVALDYRLVHFICEIARRDILKDDFCVFETFRTIETQKDYVARGVSKTMNSRHIPDENGVINAVDIVFYERYKTTVKENGKTKEVWKSKLSWNEELYYRNVKAMQEVIKDLGYEDIIEWGGSWKTFVDLPHWQIKRGK